MSTAPTGRVPDVAGATTLTFYCYGTLIDWEAGAIAALRPLLEVHGVVLSDDAIVAAMGEIEEELIQPPYRSYRSVQAGVVERFGQRFGFPVTPEQRSVLTDSVPYWRPFPDTLDGLRSLATRYRLAIISNIDDDLFAATARQLGGLITDVVTAEQARSYKPQIGIFETAMRRLGVSPAEVTHVAEGVSEVGPARRLGCATVWIRRNGRSARLLTERPDEEYPDLRSFVARLGLG